MKIYYQVKDLFPATYNFKDDTVGEDPSGWTDNSGAGCTAQIIASFMGHTKVMELYDNSGVNTAYYSNTIDDKANGTIDLFIASDDVTKKTVIALKDGGWTNEFYIWLDDSKIGYYDGANHDITAADRVNNVYTHIRIDFECGAGGYEGLAANTFYIYIDGTRYGPYGSRNNPEAIDELALLTDSGDGGGYKSYFDAIGFSWDDDYDIGDNNSVDWHDPYNKEEIENIVEYPAITSRLNMYAACTCLVRDFEGALYTDWNSMDFNPILIEDDDGNIIFRGQLTKKAFTALGLALEFKSIGELLERKSFGSEESVNYVLKEGQVANNNASSTIDLFLDADDDGDYDDPAEDFDWDTDKWAKLETGFLLVDNTSGFATDPWSSTAVAQTGGTVQGGNNASLTACGLEAEDPIDYYSVEDDSVNFNLIITPTISDAGFADTKNIKSIQFAYNYRIKVKGALAGWTKARVKLQVLKDTEWITIDELYTDRYGLSTHTTAWHYAGITIEGVEYPYNEILESGDSTELAKYFNTAGGNYTSLKGVRFKLTGGCEGDPSFAQIHVDYIKVVVTYHDDDVLPIMYHIDANGASDVTCSEVSDWTHMGVAAGVNADEFKIGVSSRKVIDDISSESGLIIAIIGEDGDTEIIRPNSDSTNQWACVNDTYENIDEDVEDPDNGDRDGSYFAQLALGDNGKFNIHGFTTFSNIVPNSVSKIILKVNAKNGNFGAGLKVDVSYDGGTTWEGEQSVGALTNSYAWYTVTYDNLELSKYNVDNFQVKLIADFTAGVIIWLDVVYAEVYYSISKLTKYVAREFKGKHCNDVLDSVCKLEGLDWYEDYENDRICLVKEADMEDSGVDLTQADYLHDWEYEDDCNQIASIKVWGKKYEATAWRSAFTIFAKAIDETVEGNRDKQINDETILTQSEAQEIADAQLALLSTKRPSIRIPLIGTNEDLVVGKTVDITMSRPTIAKTSYPIRMIERSKFGIGEIATVIYAGKGESKWDEKLFKEIKKVQSETHKIASDRLV